MFRVYTVSTSTWKDKALVSPSMCGWKRTFNETTGGLTSSFKMSDPDVLATSQAGLLTPIDRCLVVAYQGVVMYAGMIWEDDYDHDTQTLTVQHEDAAWSILALRMIAEDRTGSMAGWAKTFTGLEYDTIVKRLVQLATTGVGRAMPIVYEDDYTGGRERKYYGYNAESAVEALTELIDVPGGPDVDFRPEWNPAGDGIQWTLRTGDMNPDSQTIEVLAGVPDSAARKLKRKRSGRERATRVIGVGEGSGVDMKIRAADGSGGIELERVEQSKNTKSLTDLQDFADGELAARAGLITQYSMELDMSSPVLGNLWTLKPGATVRWNVLGDPVITPGWRSQRIIEYSGDISSPWVRLELQ